MQCFSWFRFRSNNSRRASKKCQPALTYFNLTKQLEDIYNVESEPLGVGAYGKVWAAVHRKNRHEKVAVKGIARQHFQRFGANIQESAEVKTMQALDHPNVGRILETFQDKDNYYLVMEFAYGGDLCDYMMSLINLKIELPLRKSALFLRQIISAAAHMHTLDVGHFDLKLDNVLLSEKVQQNPETLVKVVDFGLAKHVERGHKEKQIVGSKYYIAPEVLNGRYDVRADNWSCGVILYIFLTQSPPFNDHESKVLFEKVRRTVFEIPRDASANAQDLIKSLLQRDLHSRLTARKAFKHPWFREVLGADDIPRLPKGILDGLKLLAEGHSFKRLVWREVVKRSEDTQVRKFQEDFRKLDSDGQGFLTVQDLLIGFADLDEHPDNLRQDLEKYLKSIHDSGQLPYSDFIAATLIGLKHTPTDKALKSTFFFFDRSGVERISTADIDRVLRHGALQHETSEIMSLIDQVDVDQDGKLSYKEFLAFLGIKTNWKEKVVDGMLAMVRNSS